MTAELTLLLIAALAVLLAWPRRRLRVDQVYRVSPRDLWEIVVPHPGRPNLVDAIERYEWDPGSTTDATIHYHGGLRARFGQRVDPEAMRAEQAVDTLNGRGEPAERMHGRVAILPDPGGARIVMDLAFETIGRRGPWQWMHVLMRAFTAASVRGHLNQALTRSGAFARYDAAHGAAPAPQSVLGMRLSWAALALAVVACGWWAWSFGPWLTLALVLGLVLHEGGHVAVMRAFGDRSSAFYFVPFLGGIAIGRLPHAQDWQHAAMVLGGPLAGLGSAVAAGVLGWLLDSGYLSACAYFFALINLMNLAPVPPLDGGQLALLALRPFLPAAALRHVGSGLLGLGLGLSLWQGVGLLIGVFGVLLTVSLVMPAPPAQARQQPLARRHAVMLAVLSLGLAGLLAGLMAWLGADGGFTAQARALVRGPWA